MYELPNVCQHIPRLLQGVNIPEKTITEGDIVETQLWHENLGPRPSNRFQIEQSHRNATDGANSSLAKSTSVGINEGAGSGWFGRGKGRNDSSKFPVGRNERIAILSSSSWGQTTGSSSSSDPRGHNGYPVTHRGACNLDENWKSSCPAQFEDLRISDSRQGFKSFARGRTATTDFQSYGNSLVADRSGYEWRQSSCGQVLGAPLGQGGRQSSSVQGRAMASTSHHAWQHNLPPPPAPSMQGQGGRPSSCSVQGTSAGSTSHHGWQHNLSPPPAPSMQGHGWRQVVQGNAWQDNVSPRPAPSMQGYGWRQSGGSVRGMSAGSTTSQQAWRHKPSSPSAPSMQAHGRGRFTSSAAPRDWEVRDTP